MTAWKRRLRWVLMGLGAFAALVLLVVAGNSIANLRGWTVPKLDPAALSAKLAPHYRVMKPPGDGPSPGIQMRRTPIPKPCGD